MRKNDWIKIKNYYIHHNISLEDLANKFKVSKSAVFKHSRLENWVGQKESKDREIDKEVSKKLKETEIDEKVKVNKRHNELANKCLDIAEKLLNDFRDDLESGKKKRATPFNLEFIMKTIANAQKCQRLALSIDNKDTKVIEEPEVHIINGIDIKKI